MHCKVHDFVYEYIRSNKRVSVRLLSWIRQKQEKVAHCSGGLLKILLVIVCLNFVKWICGVCLMVDQSCAFLDVTDVLNHDIAAGFVQAPCKPLKHMYGAVKRKHAKRSVSNANVIATYITAKQALDRSIAYQLAQEHDEIASAVSQHVLKNMKQNTSDKQKAVKGLRLPKKLNRDTLWNKNTPGLQLEFVVDNQILAGLGNLTLHIENEFNRPAIERIRNKLRTLYESFSYKADIMDPIDWRSREYNKAAELIAGCVMADVRDIADWNMEGIITRLPAFSALQFFTDGSFYHQRGSAAIVLVANAWDDGRWYREILGYKGVLLEVCSSAFNAKASALDIATALALDMTAYTK